MLESLKQELSKIEIPAELSGRSKLGIEQAKSEMTRGVHGFMKKKLAAGLIAACLVIPTGAFAYHKLIADDFYGSFENLQKHISGATMKGYLTFDAKLHEAQGKLTKEEYEEFKGLLNILTDAKLEYGNKHGNIDYSQVPQEQLAIIKEALYAIQPYFDQLDGIASSKEVLTEEEYRQYIEALMTKETIMAQAGVTTAPNLEQIPAELQQEYVEAQEFLQYVKEKQMEYQ